VPGAGRFKDPKAVIGKLRESKSESNKDAWDRHPGRRRLEVGLDNRHKNDLGASGHACRLT
jgi:hypothetical protein